MACITGVTVNSQLSVLMVKFTEYVCIHPGHNNLQTCRKVCFCYPRNICCFEMFSLRGKSVYAKYRKIFDQWAWYFYRHPPKKKWNRITKNNNKNSAHTLRKQEMVTLSKVNNRKKPNLKKNNTFYIITSTDLHAHTAACHMVNHMAAVCIDMLFVCLGPAGVLHSIMIWYIAFTTHAQSHGAFMPMQSYPYTCSCKIKPFTNVK